MKNIHILSTDKPSRLHEYDLLSLLGLSKEPLQWRLGRNIYITSDEDINENDYIITKDGRLVEVSYLLSKDLQGASKIILTTDQDLIKDDVQAIDDEFLEWFVENTSCEEVKTIKVPYFDESGYSHLLIIPKEEQTKCYCGHTTTCDCGPEELEITQLEILETPMPIYKQETLEEIAVRLVKETTLYGSQEAVIGSSARSYFETELRCVLMGMKWQQERSYSEEEVYDLMDKREHYWVRYKNYYAQSYIPFDEWFEQFKKK